MIKNNMRLVTSGQTSGYIPVMICKNKEEAQKCLSALKEMIGRPSL